ncbi:conserved membrane hypothetical protein [Vibrio chagasii]|nr:conserved membrane hypothetical protein [Vibrio chagasii]CAH7344795.1 conserved membrane hypothetical protein [Vibrio chagasii]
MVTNMYDAFKSLGAQKTRLPEAIMSGWLVAALFGICLVFPGSQFGLGVYDFALTVAITFMIALSSKFREDTITLLGGLTIYTALFYVFATIRFGYNDSPFGILYVHAAILMGAVYFSAICLLTTGPDRLKTYGWNELVHKGGLITPLIVINYFAAPLVYMRQVFSGLEFDYPPLVMVIHFWAVSAGLWAVLSLVNRDVHRFLFKGRFDIIHALLILAPLNIVVVSLKVANYDLAALHWVDMTYLVITFVLYVLGAARMVSDFK